MPRLSPSHALNSGSAATVVAPRPRPALFSKPAHVGVRVPRLSPSHAVNGGFAATVVAPQQRPALFSKPAYAAVCVPRLSPLHAVNGGSDATAVAPRQRPALLSKPAHAVVPAGALMLHALDSGYAAIVASLRRHLARSSELHRRPRRHCRRAAAAVEFVSWRATRRVRSEVSRSGQASLRSTTASRRDIHDASLVIFTKLSTGLPSDATTDIRHRLQGLAAMVARR